MLFKCCWQRPDNPNRLQRKGTNSNEMDDKDRKARSPLPRDHYKEFADEISREILRSSGIFQQFSITEIQDRDINSSKSVVNELSKGVPPLKDPYNPNRLQRKGTNSNEIGDKARKAKSALPWDHYKDYYHPQNEKKRIIFQTLRQNSQTLPTRDSYVFLPLVKSAGTNYHFL